MRQEKNQNIIIVLLLIIIVILGVLCVLLALKSNKQENNKQSNTQNNSINENNDLIGNYKGLDPWDNELLVELKSINSSTLKWTISNEYYEKELVSELSNGETKFSIKGIFKDGSIECNYTGTLTLNDNSISIKYESGQLTSISPNGDAGFMMAEALEENSKTVILKKVNNN